MREREMHEPVVQWLEGQGYRVSAEVKHCDLVARDPSRPDEPIILELKTRLSLDLVAQGTARQELSESVYLVVPVTGSQGKVRNARSAYRVLRRLGLGLLLVRYLRGGTRVEVVFHPDPSPPRIRTSRRRAILREIDHRYAELNYGGQTVREEHFSAYRQRAMRLAALMSCDRERTWSPAELIRAGADPSAQPILSRNVYGWFDRVSRGRYRLSAAGHVAMQRYRRIAPHVLEPYTA